MIIRSFLLLASSLLLFADSWETAFRDPPGEARMGVYWWWFGPAQTKAEIDRELRVMKDAGILRILIYPIYAYAADDPAKGIRHYRYLSPEFLDVLAYAVETSRKMGFDTIVPLGSGWPYGGPNVPPRLAAQRLKVIVQSPEAAASGAPPLEPDARLICRLLVPGDGRRVELTGVRELPEGQAIPRGLSGPHVVMTFYQAPTGMTVKRPSLGGEGLVLDHLSREALDHYLHSTGAALLHALKKGAAVHADSFEVYASSWTTGFLNEFKRRRGYDLTLFLPALFADAGPATADIRHDFWRTVGDLALDNHLRPLSEWCRSNGLELQAESYGTPALDMRGFQWIDRPMGESLDWKNFVASRWSSSAAHQTGRRWVGTEAWTWLRRPRYISTLEDMKVGADMHFLCGINRFVGHGYAYSPPQAGTPGWGYYASVMLNENNTVFRHFRRTVSDYVARAGYALSLGKPRRDIALYLPQDDVRASQALDSGPDLYKSSLNLYLGSKFRLGTGHVAEFGLASAFKTETPVIKTILSSGYAFDGIDSLILQPSLRTSGGRLAVGDASYRIVVLPNLAGISLPMLEKIAEFCRGGGVVIATRRLPDRIYGWKDRDAMLSRMSALISGMFGKNGRNRYGKGLALFVGDESAGLAQALAELNPQVRFVDSPGDFYFVQRGQPGRELYFIANMSGEKRRLKASFRDAQGGARQWDPATGAAAGLPVPDDGVVEMDLEGYGSRILVFDRDWKREPRATGARQEERVVGVIAGPWTLRIGADTVPLDRLKYWTEFPAHRFFSGSATYESAFDIASPGSGLQLQLTGLREAAEVSINGRPCGLVWMRPWRLEIAGCVAPGRNHLSIAVTNLPINGVLGAPLTDFSGLATIQFPLPQEKTVIREPYPSGLAGEVKLIGFREEAGR